MDKTTIALAGIKAGHPLAGSHCILPASLVAQMVKNLTAMLETWDRSLGPIPASGCPPGGGHGNPLQYSCLENPMDRGAWQTTPHGVAKSWTQLSEFHIHITFSTHSALLILFFFICSEFCHTMK